MARTKGFIRSKTMGCERCGEQRQVAHACPSCGARPERHEVDYIVEARQRRIAQARECGPCFSAVEPLDVDTLIPDISAGVFDMLRALATLLDQRTSIDSFHRKYQKFQMLCARSHLLLPRPHRNQGRAAAALLDAVSMTVEATLDAAACADMGQAQRLAFQAQRHTDDAALLWEEIAPSRQAWDLQQLNLLGQDERQEASDFLDTIARIDAHAPAVHGPHTNGSGLIAEINYAAADAFLDRQNFDILLEEALSIVDRAEVAQIAADPEWVHQHQLASTRAAGDMAKLDRTLNAPDVTEAECLDALMDFVDDLHEVRVRYVLAALFKIYGNAMPPGGRGEGVSGAGSLLNKAASTWPSLGINSTFSSEARNIAAHRDYHLDGGTVVLSSRLDPTASRFSIDVFIDTVLGQLEVVLALETALEIALARQGCSIPPSPATSRIVREAGLTLGLSVAGLTQPRFVWGDGYLHITALGNSAEFHPLVAGLTNMLPDEVTVLLIDCTGHEVIADLKAFRAFQARGQLSTYEDAMATIATCASMRIDGTSPYPDPDSDWAGFVYWVGATARPQGLATLVREVKRAQRICELADARDGCRACEELLIAARSGALDNQGLPAGLHT